MWASTTKESEGHQGGTGAKTDLFVEITEQAWSE